MALRRWSVEERQFLRDNCGSLSRFSLAQKLNRSEKSVEHQLVQLGLLVGTKRCQRCGEDRPLAQFGIYHRTCKPCHDARFREKRRNDPERRAIQRQYEIRYYRANPARARIKSYQSIDRKRGVPSLTMAEGTSLLDNAACHYCGTSDRQLLGLDRKDNSLGHAPINVVPCCMECNFILSDIPYEAKLLLADGLRACRRAGYLDAWRIPTHRNAVAA
jgi:hypothetical protein